MFFFCLFGLDYLKVSY